MAPAARTREISDPCHIRANSPGQYLSHREDRTEKSRTYSPYEQPKEKGRP